MMKKSFATKRVPRKIGSDEENDAGAGHSGEPSPTPGSAVKRPGIKPRKNSSLRTARGPSSIRDEDDGDEAAVVIPKRSTLSRVAIQRNASKKSPWSVPHLSVRDASENDRDDEGPPSYSTESLRELRNSTPSTPRDLSVVDHNAMLASSGSQELDLASNLASQISQSHSSSAIPSAAEIAEKKARRARLAKEQQAEEYISLDPDNPDLDNSDDDSNVTRDEFGRLVLKPKDKHGQSESRLVREDEDIMENFDEFTEDGGISLSRHAEAEAARKRRQDMAAQIAQAEAAASEHSEDSDASERERNAHFEAAQTRHGTYARNTTDKARTRDAAARPRTPPIITPLPTLHGALERLRQQLAAMQTSRSRKLQEMEAMKREKVRLAEEEVRIQNALKETAEKFAQLRKERGIATETKDPTTDLQTLSRHSGLIMDVSSVDPPSMHEEDNSLQDHLGNDATSDSDADDDDGNNNKNIVNNSHQANISDSDSDSSHSNAFANMGLGSSRHGFGSGLGFAGGPRQSADTAADDDDDDYY